MQSKPSGFRLLLEPAPSLPAPPHPLAVPEGVAVWNPREGDLAPLPGDNRPAGALLLESVAFDGKRRLLVVAHGNHLLQVNDLRVAGAALLKSGDQIRVDSGPAWEIAFFREVKIGPPSPAQAGAQCPVCLGTITADTRVYECGCGTLFHLEIDATAAREEPRKCGEVISTCPRCREQIRNTAGYLSTPAFLEP